MLSKDMVGLDWSTFFDVKDQKEKQNPKLFNSRRFPRAGKKIIKKI